MTTEHTSSPMELLYMHQLSSPLLGRWAYRMSTRMQIEPQATMRLGQEQYATARDRERHMFEMPVEGLEQYIRHKTFTRKCAVSQSIDNTLYETDGHRPANTQQQLIISQHTIHTHTHRYCVYTTMCG